MMGYRYLVIPNELEAADGQDHRALLQALGLRHQSPMGRFAVLAAVGTPTLSVQERCVIVGHLFRNDGGLVRDGEDIPLFAAPADLEAHLLGNFWGDYILLQGLPADSSLVVMRSPSGGMPCFYAGQSDRRFVTSDVSAAVSLGLCKKEVDWNHIRHGLTFPYLRAQQTGISGVRELLPGCSLRMGRQATAVHRAWSPWQFVAPGRRYGDALEAAQAVRQAVARAVQAWAEVDRKILLEISGGLDSSIVAACLGQATVEVQACTLVTPVPGADERDYARTMMDHVGFSLDEEHIRFEDARFEFAVSQSSTVPMVGILHYASDKAMEVAGDRGGAASYFSGGGGDTIFCYLKGAAPAADAFKEHGLSAGMTAIRDLATLHQCTWWKAAKLTLRKLRSRPHLLWKADTNFLAPSGVSQPHEHHPWFDLPADILPGDRERIFELIGAQSFKDGVPRDERRPVRFPLLAQPVVEACLRAPTWMWIAEGRNRSVARAAFADRLPAAILSRRSKGSYLNYCGAVYARQKSGMRDFLLGGRLRSHGYLDTAQLERFFAADLPARDLSFLRIFDLCMVENWVRQQT
ncbi:Asparagine synthetase [glutamine-hydrolyzing] [plant metagenome]|uniref:Asparagine synthetase [glutamine-hydrolyzing] n=1 Tax=plant metagenome TaxID=1297885 RepID=A0A484P6F1_9ZZZZ